MKLSIVVAMLAVLQAGCLFEPECSTYEECTESGDSATNNATTSGNTATGNNETTPPNRNANTTSSNESTPPDCSLTDCPPSDNYSFGGTSEDPLGCQFSSLEFFEFEDQAAVCAGSPRGYSVWIEACSNPYIVEVEVTVADSCVGTALLDFDMEGFACGRENTRCESNGNTATAQFFIDSASFRTQRLDFEVGAESGGFDYVVTVRSRR